MLLLLPQKFLSTVLVVENSEDVVNPIGWAISIPSTNDSELFHMHYLI